MPGVIGVYTNDDLGLARRPTVMGIDSRGDGAVRSWRRGPFATSASRSSRSWPRPARSRRTPPSWWSSTTSRCRSWSTSPRRLEGPALLFPEAQHQHPFGAHFGGDDTMFDGCEVGRRADDPQPARGALPAGGAAAAGAMGADGRLGSVPDPGAHGVRDPMASLLGLEPDQVHVITPDVGGAFGAKVRVYPEESWWPGAPRSSAGRCAGPRRRSESMVGLGHGRAQVQLVTMGGSRDGKVHRVSQPVLQDSGAYPEFGTFLPFMTRTWPRARTRSPRPSAAACRW